jgi:hypothetical protein
MKDADALASALELAAPAWRRLARLELDYTATTAYQGTVEWRPILRAAGALPALRSLRLAGAIPLLPDGVPVGLREPSLQDLEVVGLPDSPSLSGLAVGLPGLDNLSRLSLARAPALRYAHVGRLTSLKVGAAAVSGGGAGPGLPAGRRARLSLSHAASVHGPGQMGSKLAVPGGAAVLGTWLGPEIGALQR